jgi:TRAP-type C4-dicarboxylate transport system permease small subunit
MQDAPVLTTRVVRSIDYLSAAIGGLAIAAFTSIIVYVVVCRYAFSFTPSWSEEVPRLLLVWVTFIGGISAFIRKTHLCAGLTDLIVSPGRLRTVLAALARAAAILFLIVLVWSGWKMTVLTWSHETTVLSWPAGLFYLALPVTGVVSLVALLFAEFGK